MHRTALAVALALCVGCKSKQQAPAAAAWDASAVAAADATAAAASAAPAPPPPPPTPAAAMPSETLVAAVPKGPQRAGDGRIVWCTRGDNGMAEWAEVLCHIATPGKKTSVIPVMTYADAMAVDEGVDPAVDADAGVKAESARQRVEAGLAKLVSDAGGGLKAMPESIICRFQGGEFTGRDDDPLGSHEGCKQGHVAAHISAPGKVQVVVDDKVLFTEVFKARPRGRGDGGNECYLEASTVELAIDTDANLIAIAVALSNPSDACALVTEYEVRAVRLP